MTAAPEREGVLTNLFTYGTLMIPGVMEAVVGYPVQQDTCEVYLLSDRHADRLTYDEWDPAQFMEDHGADYLAMCEAFRVQELDAAPRAGCESNDVRETQEA